MYSLVVLLASLSAVLSKPVYEHSKSNVMPLTNFNFNDQISKIRQTTNYVSLVHFYKYTDGKSLEFAPAFDSWTNEYRGVFRICAVDCDTYADLCRKEDITRVSHDQALRSYSHPAHQISGIDECYSG
jgi:thioredoxin-like negative regulator of GroEL